jgi:hypothetical protein
VPAADACDQPGGKIKHPRDPALWAPIASTAAMVKKAHDPNTADAARSLIGLPRVRY